MDEEKALAGLKKLSAAGERLSERRRIERLQSNEPEIVWELLRKVPSGSPLIKTGSRTHDGFTVEPHSFYTHIMTDKAGEKRFYVFASETGVKQFYAGLALKRRKGRDENHSEAQPQLSGSENLRRLGSKELL